MIESLVLLGTLTTFFAFATALGVWQICRYIRRFGGLFMAGMKDLNNTIKSVKGLLEAIERINLEKGQELRPH